MKKALMVLMALALVAGAIAAPASAGKKKRKKPVKVERDASLDYTSPGGVWAPAPAGPVNVAQETEQDVGQLTFTAEGKEKYVSLLIADDSTNPVPALVETDSDGDGAFDATTTICDATEAPLRIAKASDVLVTILAGPCPDNTPATATQGSVTATFSNLP